MRTSRLRDQLQSRVGIVPANGSPMSDCRLAIRIEMTQRALVGKTRNRQVYATGRFVWFAFDQGFVDLMRAARFEALRKASLCERMARKDHDAGRVHVEAVNDERLAMSSARYALGASRLVCAPAWHTEQSARLVDDDNVIINMHGHQRLVWWRPVRRGAVAHAVVCLSALVPVKGIQTPNALP